MSLPPMSQFNFLDFPIDLQIGIIGTLDGPSIVACARTSRVLATLIEDVLELKYKHELALCGMVDGSPSGPSLRERVAALKAYREAWATGHHPIERVYVHSLWGLSANTNGTLVAHHARTLGEPDAKLSIIVPREPFCGIPTSSQDFERWGAFINGKLGVVFVIDPAQDLLVYTRRQIPPTGPNQTPPSSFCGFVSLSDRFAPHSQAPRATFRSCLPPTSTRAVDVLHLLGDLVAWSVECEHEETGLYVINWKTGTVVWHLHGKSGWHIRLLTESTLAVIHDGLTLQLFAFDPARRVICPRLRPEDAACVLHLPAVHERELDYFHISSFIQHPPPPPPDSQPRFTPDPELTALVLHIRLTPKPPPKPMRPSIDRSRHYALFVPLKTLAKCFQTSSASRASPPGIHEGSHANAGPPPRVIPWEEWGPHGTRMIRIRHLSKLSSVMGPRAAVIAHSDGKRPSRERPGICTVTIYEVFELASVRTSADISSVPRDSEPGTSAGGSGTEDDWHRDRLWREPVQTTYPYRATTRVIDLEWGEALPVLYRVLLSRDGLALLRTHVAS